MPNMTDKEIKKLLKEASKFLRKGMEIGAIEQKNSGKPIEFDMKIEMGIGGVPTMAGPSGDYQTLHKCFYICYTFDGVRYCWPYCE